MLKFIVLSHSLRYLTRIKVFPMGENIGVFPMVLTNGNLSDLERGIGRGERTCSLHSQVLCIRDWCPCATVVSESDVRVWGLVLKIMEYLGPHITSCQRAQQLYL